MSQIPTAVLETLKDCGLTTAQAVETADTYEKNHGRSLGKQVILSYWNDIRRNSKIEKKTRYLMACLKNKPEASKEPEPEYIQHELEQVELPLRQALMQAWRQMGEAFIDHVGPRIGNGESLPDYAHLLYWRYLAGADPWIIGNLAAQFGADPWPYLKDNKIQENIIQDIIDQAEAKRPIVEGQLPAYEKYVPAWPIMSPDDPDYLKPVA